MQLGVVLTGTGIFGAAGIGVLEALEERRIAPYAVCGIETGAWVAALHAVGRNAAQMREAAEQVRKLRGQLLRPQASGRALLKGKRLSLLSDKTLEHLLIAQTGGRILALCPQRVIFPFRSSQMELVLASQVQAAHGMAITTMQATASFAARAAMALPPFLSPVEWIGSPLMPERDVARAANLLLTVGAHRVLVVRAVSSARHVPDALELTAFSQRRDSSLGQGAAELRLTMPDELCALSLEQIEQGIDRGKKMAERELDRIFEQMGMASCRILPFRRDG